MKTLLNFLKWYFGLRGLDFIMATVGIVVPTSLAIVWLCELTNKL